LKIASLRLNKLHVENKYSKIQANKHPQFFFFPDEIIKRKKLETIINLLGNRRLMVEVIDDFFSDLFDDYYY